MRIFILLTLLFCSLAGNSWAVSITNTFEDEAKGIHYYVFTLNGGDDEYVGELKDLKIKMSFYAGDKHIKTDWMEIDKLATCSADMTTDASFGVDFGGYSVDETEGADMSQPKKFLIREAWATMYDESSPKKEKRVDLLKEGMLHWFNYKPIPIEIKQK